MPKVEGNLVSCPKRSTTKRNLAAYGILIAPCLIVAFVATSFPHLFADGPPSWRLFLSIPGTAAIVLLGLIGIFFLDRSGLRGLWDRDLGITGKILIPLAVGIVIGVVSATLHIFIPIDAVLAQFARSQGVDVVAPSLGGAVLGYFSGGVLINIVFFLILIPPVVYLVSCRLLRGQREGLVFWAIAVPLALWDPLTNPPLSFSISAFGIAGAVGITVLGSTLGLVQAWFMRAAGFIALVFVRLGVYAITHVLYPHVF